VHGTNVQLVQDVQQQASLNIRRLLPEASDLQNKKTTNTTKNLPLLRLRFPQ
jgi:hypothetical protein